MLQITLKFFKIEICEKTYEISELLQFEIQIKLDVSTNKQ